MTAPRRIRLRLFAPGAAILAAISLPGFAAEAPRNVLVLYSYGRLLPANAEADRGIRKAVAGTADRTVTVFDEFLDSPMFNGRPYDQALAADMREKYGAHRPGVLVAIGRVDGTSVPTVVVLAAALAVVGLGFIWVAIDDEKQSWHDTIAGTTVVSVPKGVSLL